MTKTKVEWEGAFDVVVSVSNRKHLKFKACYGDLNVFAQATGHCHGRGDTAEEAVVNLFKEHPREKIASLLRSNQ